MAAHRRPRKRPLGGSTARTAATIALAGAASAAGFDGTGHADPRLTPTQAQARVTELYEEAEVATEKYNGAEEEADTAQERLDDLRDEAARRTALLESAREELGAMAAARYRGGGLDPAWQLALSGDPDRYLAEAAYAERLETRQASNVTRVRKHLRGLEQLQDAAHTELATLRSRQTELRRHKTTITAKLGEARRLLARTRAVERAERDRAGGTRSTSPSTASSPPQRPSGPSPAAPSAVPAPNSRTSAAITYAYSKLGSPYVWGATGPDAFDCSGLVQAAYRSAGVSLPRTTYAQIDVGRRVPRSQLLPGDLVFFYSGISHVGIYVGNGRMIHAPNPSAPVRVAPLDEMPFAGASRVV
ncbi:NlpC/P60 family protein [Streptomyces sp. CRN 30]|uniref:C40 family peptidase n=1 Tax=Streptomyces sp. CRN 30 TaxID=3075613 RepID=UPI002A8360DC|nr:NlpC/P60 family protein [Streptomyces sp. CRN 30]